MLGIEGRLEVARDRTRDKLVQHAVPVNKKSGRHVLCRQSRMQDEGMPDDCLERRDERHAQVSRRFDERHVGMIGQRTTGLPTTP